MAIYLFLKDFCYGQYENYFPHQIYRLCILWKGSVNTQTNMLFIFYPYYLQEQKVASFYPDNSNSILDWERELIQRYVVGL